MVNSNIVLIIASFSIAVAAIYALYSIILYQGNGKKGEELQLTTKNILEQVEILYDKKEYALVELLATKYLDRVPTHIGVRKFLAKAYYEIKKYNQAIRHCNVILQTNANDVETHRVLGKCFIKKRFLNKAIDELYFVYERNKKDREIVQTLAELYTKTEQLHMAITAYNELVDLTPEKEIVADIYSILAELNETSFDYPAAFEAYKSRLAIYPKDVETNKKLAELYIKISNYPIAIETLLLMLSFVTEPKMLLWVFETLVDLYETTEDYEKAIAYAEKLLDVPGSDKFKVRDRIAGFNLKIGKMNDGILILEDLSMMTQNGFDVTLELCSAYIENGEHQKALDKYLVLLDKATQKEAKIINGLIADLYIKWSLPFMNEGDYIKAMEYLDNALQYSPVNPEAYYYKAYSHFLQKNYTNTVELINKAINYDKDKVYHAKYLLILSQAHHELGHFFEEKKALTDLLTIDSKNAQGLYRLGLMYAAQHDIKNAEESFKNAITYDPELVHAKYNLALIYENSNKEKAKELYIEVLEQDPSFIEAKNALTDLTASGEQI